MDSPDNTSPPPYYYQIITTEEHVKHNLCPNMRLDILVVPGVLTQVMMSGPIRDKTSLSSTNKINKNNKAE